MPATVRDNTVLHCFELDAEGEAAVAYYQLTPGVITFTHTEVPPHLQGHVARELGPLGQHLEHHAETKLRADHHIGGGELLAHDIRSRRDRLGHHVHHRVEVAIAEHAAARLLLARGGAVGHRRLDAAW